jgi:hypothetical protein
VARCCPLSLHDLSLCAAGRPAARKEIPRHMTGLPPLGGVTRGTGRGSRSLGRRADGPGANNEAHHLLRSVIGISPAYRDREQVRRRRGPQKPVRVRCPRRGRGGNLSRPSRSGTNHPGQRPLPYTPPARAGHCHPASPGRRARHRSPQRCSPVPPGLAPPHFAYPSPQDLTCSSSALALTAVRLAPMIAA